MNNTKTLTIVAVFIAAALVAGTCVTTTTIATTQSALAAYGGTKKVGPQQQDNKIGTRDNGNDNGNTVTIQKCEQAATQSGFDNDQSQECENLICTHPENNATCTQEGVKSAAPIPTPVKSPCEQCFTSLLSLKEINKVVAFFSATSLADLCRILEQNNIQDDTFSDALEAAGVSETIGNELFACLREAGIVFLTD